MGKTLKRESCSNCKSSNNLVTWQTDDGNIVTTCMTPNCQVNNSTTFLMPSPKLEKEPQELLTLEYKDTRGISEETCRKIGIGWSGDNIVFEYLLAQKSRIQKGDKKIMPWINYHENRGLFGQFRQEFDYTKPLILTEGELDTASCLEAGHQAVSISTGAGNQTIGEIQQHKTFLDQFPYIIIWFDNDEAGESALTEVLKLFPIHKIKIIKSITKDANEILQKEGSEAVKTQIKKGFFQRPKGIIKGSEIDFKNMWTKEPEGYKTGLPSFDEHTKGIRKGRFYMLGAGTGAGKSTLYRKIAHYWIKNTDLKIVNLFLEEQQKDTLQGYIAIDQNIHVDKLRLNPMILSELQKENSLKLLKSENLLFTDAQFSLDSKQLFDILDYVAKCEKVDIIILDHISIVVENSSLSGQGERKDIDKLCYKLRQLVHETGVTIMAIVHLTEPDNKRSFEEGRKIRMADFRGSGALGQVPDVCMGLVRDMQSNKSSLWVLKNRINSYVGLTDELIINDDTGIPKTIKELMK